MNKPSGIHTFSDDLLHIPESFSSQYGIIPPSALYYISNDYGQHAKPTTNSAAKFATPEQYLPAAQLLYHRRVVLRLLRHHPIHAQAL